MSNLATGTDIHLENPEYETRWYFKYFLGKIHQNYVGLDVDKRVVFLSVVLTDANNHNVPQYRSILWRTTGTQKICIPYNPAKPMSVKRILSRFDIKMDKSPKEIFTPDIQKELLLLEEQEGSVNFKFGVLYAKEGQKSDDEMFSNENGSEEFYNFVRLLGDNIKLKNWDKFNGGLDVKNNTTGLEAVYTMYEGHEIMFHVSTMLPYSKDNRQQVERKRHIGNDIVTIVFQEQENPEAEPTFKPSMIKSHFTHIFALVTFNKSANSYRLRVFSEESVPLFGPPLPSPSVFEDTQAFRDFLLVKLINGEKAAFNTPTFANKRQRTLEMLIKNLQQDLPETNKNMLNKRSLSDVIPEPVWGWRNKKEEARQVEFVRVGQLLKLKTIVKGDAPTSLATTSLLKREPWEPQCIHNDFAHEVQCGDSWGDRLIVGTEVGIFCIEEGLPPRMLFDRTVTAKQLSVVEAHDLLIFRADKGKESRVYVFRLTDFEGEPNELIVRTKNDCKDHKLERTKGCQLYALSRPGGSHLRMVVAVGKKLLVMAWKHSAAWTAWCMAADTDPVEGFTFVRELVASEVPNLMTLVDGGKEDNQICVAFRNQFDLINEKNGDTFRLHLVETSKVNLVSALDIYEDEEPELLLSYNHVSQFKKLNGENSSDFDIHWNSAPKAIVCAFPYILAFTHDSMEIRLVVNGNLVHTMTMPRLNLISSKCDLHFTSTGTPDLLHGLQPSPRDPIRPFSPLASPTNPNAIAPMMGSPTRIFKIPLISLVGQMTERPVQPTNNRPRSFISPLVNIAETSSANKPTNRLTTRPQSDTALSAYEKNMANDSGNAEGLAPWRTGPQLPRPSGEYSDSGYSESDVSFESADCTDAPRGYPYESARVGQDSSAEMRRKMFSCLHSPRQQRRTLSSQSADPEARAELLGTSKSKSRSRFGSNHSDSVFYSNSRTPGLTDSRSSSVASETDSCRSDTGTLQSWPRSIPRFGSSGSTTSQSEAEMRAELLGKLLRSPKLGRPSTSSTMSTQSDSEDRGSVFESVSPVNKTSHPFYLSSSVDEDDIDLK
ncbi:GTPase-activating Rap/Ran-GAP domain-like protein 3 isoform X2 [Patiria miniata]|uniref:GTPase-activating Rap/Ran-GAP domain-like protein 3 n=1 Tax=Patiria miniata TaxID=46514 RepID=A0A913Z6P6_PATMI|nr:GTPase-activating Rap/Ran-GAP domain-like protein 3 isoform X2 [Patiria miniata]